MKMKSALSFLFLIGIAGSSLAASFFQYEWVGKVQTVRFGSIRSNRWIIRASPTDSWKLRPFYPDFGGDEKSFELKGDFQGDETLICMGDLRAAGSAKTAPAECVLSAVDPDAKDCSNISPDACAADQSIQYVGKYMTFPARPNHP